MKKLAIFVEGNTELVFLEKLIIELVGYHKVVIQKQQLHGNSAKSLYTSGANNNETKFHILIVNCECDGKVKPAIQDRMQSLKKNGYEAVIGLRDAYPQCKKHENLEMFKNGLQKGLDELPIPTYIILAIMEIEAWFIDEWTHFERASPQLTADFINKNFNIDIKNTSAESIEKPAMFLKKIYSRAQITYKKKDKDAHKVANLLDYHQLYLVVREKNPSLNELFTKLDTFFTPAPN